MFRQLKLFIYNYLLYMNLKELIILEGRLNKLLPLKNSDKFNRIYKLYDLKNQKVIKLQEKIIGLEGGF